MGGLGRSPTSFQVIHFSRLIYFSKWNAFPPQYGAMGPKSANCCAPPVILGQKSSLSLPCWAHAGITLLKVTDRPHHAHLANVSGMLHLATWANRTGDCTHHSPSWVQACFQSQLGKRLGLLSFGNRSPLFGRRASNSSNSSPHSDLPARLSYTTRPLTPLSSWIKLTGVVISSLQMSTASTRVRELTTKWG